jgi:hypothetical protein
MKFGHSSGGVGIYETVAWSQRYDVKLNPQGNLVAVAETDVLTQGQRTYAGLLCGCKSLKPGEELVAVHMPPDIRLNLDLLELFHIMRLTLNDFLALILIYATQHAYQRLV